MKGFVLGLDGWQLNYDTDDVPGDITVTNAAGVRQVVISGNITPGMLNREIAAFRAEHCHLEQAPLFAMEGV